MLATSVVEMPPLSACTAAPSVGKHCEAKKQRERRKPSAPILAVYKTLFFPLSTLIC